LGAALTLTCLKTSNGHAALLTQINSTAVGSHRIPAGLCSDGRTDVRHQSGGWAFHYDGGANRPDEVGFHFADERFIPGEYVSINEGGKMNTYRVVSVSHL